VRDLRDELPFIGSGCIVAMAWFGVVLGVATLLVALAAR